MVKLLMKKKYYIKKDLITTGIQVLGIELSDIYLKKYFNLFLNDKIRIKKELIGLKKFILEKSFSINLR